MCGELRKYKTIPVEMFDNRLDQLAIFALDLIVFVVRSGAEMMMPHKGLLAVRGITFRKCKPKNGENRDSDWLMIKPN